MNANKFLIAAALMASTCQSVKLVNEMDAPELNEFAETTAQAEWDVDDALFWSGKANKIANDQGNWKNDDDLFSPEAQAALGIGNLIWG